MQHNSAKVTIQCLTINAGTSTPESHRDLVGCFNNLKGEMPQLVAVGVQDILPTGFGSRFTKLFEKRDLEKESLQWRDFLLRALNQVVEHSNYNFEQNKTDQFLQPYVYHQMKAKRAHAMFLFVQQDLIPNIKQVRLDRIDAESSTLQFAKNESTFVLSFKVFETPFVVLSVKLDDGKCQPIKRVQTLFGILDEVFTRSKQVPPLDRHLALFLMGSLNFSFACSAPEAQDLLFKA
jgi:hypothetical protein